MDSQEDPKIEIGAFDKDGEMVCFVKDNGSGIDPRYHKRIFGLFDKLEQKTDGTGIGLALVMRIIEVHNRSIWVENPMEMGKGSTFFFTLPLK